MRWRGEGSGSEFLQFAGPTQGGPQADSIRKEMKCFRHFFIRSRGVFHEFNLGFSGEASALGDPTTMKLAHKK